MKRPGPSPAAPSGEASRPPLFSSEAFGGLRNDVEDGIDAVGIHSPHGRGEVGVPVEKFAYAESPQVLLVIRERGRDYGRSRVGGQLDEEAADAAGGTDDEHAFALGRRECIDGGGRGEPGERRGPGEREVDAGWRSGPEVVLREGDQFGPAPGVHRRIGVRDEAEDAVPDVIAADALADLCDDAGEVAAEGDRELVFDHLLQRACSDVGVDWVDRRGVHAHDELVLTGVRLEDFPQGGLGFEAV